MGKIVKYVHNSKHFFVVIILFVCAILIATFFQLSRYPSHSTIQFPVESISSLSSREFSKMVRDAIGYSGEEIYLFCDDAPMIILSSEYDLEELHFSLMVPVYRTKTVRYTVYQLRLEKQNELLIAKSYEVNNPTQIISMSMFWDSLFYMPINHVRNKTDNKADQYMLTLLDDNFVFDHNNVEEQILEETLVYYERDGEVDVELSGSAISWVVLPLYEKSENSHELRGISDDSFVFRYFDPHYD